MPSYGLTIARNQPDGTQGIAKVELKNGSDELIAELVGCVIHLSKKDKSLRNILQVETNCKMEYFIFVPWFHSCRPTDMNENSTKIEVKLHRYGKKEIEKQFLVDEEKCRGIFEKYCSDNYFVICPESKNFQKSSFLKKWSSDLLLFNNSSQVSQSRDLFYGIKKVEPKNLLKFCGFKKESDKLDEHGVLLIRSSNESYVIGCYEKDNGRIKKYCFLLKGLEEIAEFARGTDNPTPEQPPSGRIEEGEDNPTPDQPSSRRIEEGGDNPTPDQPSSRRIEEGGDNPPPNQPSSRRIEEGGDNPPPNQPSSRRIEEEGGNPPPDQLSSRRIEEEGGNPTVEQLHHPLWRNPALDEPQESEDGRIGSELVVVVSGRHSSRPMNHETERAKTEKKELIRKTYGPRVGNMNLDVKHEVCLMLNPIQKLNANDYRKVADEIDLTHYQIKNLAKENPMEDVFEVMIGQAKTVDEFVDILFKIDRGDVVLKMYDMAKDMALHTQS